MYLSLTQKIRYHISILHLQGGRLVTERRMVADLYVFDLETFLWQKILPNPDDDIPKARYFHSADACKPFQAST